MFTIEYNFEYGNLVPNLLAEADFCDIYKRQGDLVNRVIEVRGKDTLLLADNLDDLVRFCCVDEEGKNWSSRAGVFNTLDESVAIVSVVCASWIQYFKLPYIQSRIKEARQNIGFLKVEVSDKEYYYIPYETVERQNVIRNVRSMYRTWILEDISPNGDRELSVSDVIKPT